MRIVARLITNAPSLLTWSSMYCAGSCYARRSLLAPPLPPSNWVSSAGLSRRASLRPLPSRCQLESVGFADGSCSGRARRQRPTSLWSGDGRCNSNKDIDCSSGGTDDSENKVPVDWRTSWCTTGRKRRSWRCARTCCTDRGQSWTRSTRCDVVASRRQIRPQTTARDEPLSCGLPTEKIKTTQSKGRFKNYCKYGNHSPAMIVNASG